MFNINTSVRLLLDAEKIKASRHLTNDEKIELLSAMRDSVAVIPNLPKHALAVRQSLCRMVQDETKTDDDRAGPAVAKAQKQGRKAKGVKEQTQVDTRRAEESPEASKGSSEGVIEQTEDSRRADTEGTAPPETSASPEA